MNIQGELANAINQRYAKVHGVPKTARKSVKQNGKSAHRQEPAMSEAEQASRKESKNAAAAALMAKMAGGSRQPTSSSATSKGGKTTKSWKVSSASPKISSTVTGGDPLSKTEEETAQRYRKMIKMGLAKGAVRHKMISGGVSERIVEAVMSGKNSSNSQAPILQKAPVDATNRRSSLSLEEDKVAEKYRKMAKIGMPKGAIRHKMNSDGVSERIVEAVNSGEGSFHSQTPVLHKVSMDTSDQRFSLTTEEERIFEKYKKMAKMGMPEGAIRHKMIADGVSEKIQDAVMTGDSSSASTTRHKKENNTATNRGDDTRSNRSSLSTEEEKIAAQYRRMIKIKMPDGAVRHKMIADGVSPKIQDSVLGREIPETMSPSSPPSSSSRGGESKGNLSSLSSEDETTAAPYRKMMKMRMPKGAVKHKMTVDRISTSIQNSVLRGEIPAQDSVRRDDGAAATHMHSPANPLFGAIASSCGIGSLKKTSRNEKKPAAASTSSNPLLGALASSGGIGSLKKTSKKEKKPAAASTFSNPLAAAIASSGGLKSLKKKSVNERKPATAAMSSNPLAAAIASSGGLKSLKKRSVNEKKPATAAMSSNPLAAAIASSGGLKSLKKRSVNEKKPATAAMSSNPLAAAIAASRGKRGLRKTHRNDTNPKQPKLGSGNTLLDELSSRGFDSSLKKTFQKAPEQPTNFSTGNADVSRRHLAGIKVKSVRSPKESFEESTNFINAESPPRRHLGGIKVKSIRLREKSEGSTDIINTDDSPKYLGGIKIKSVRSFEKSSEKNNNLTDDNIPRQFQSGIKVKSVRLLEEKANSTTSTGHSTTKQEEQATNRRTNGHATSRLQSDNQVKSTSLPLQQPASYASTDSGSKNSSKSFQVADKIEDEQHKSITDAHCQDLAATETDLEREMNKKFRNQTSRPKTKMRNSQLKFVQQQKNKKPNVITTEDGVEHHCLCILM